MHQWEILIMTSAIRPPKWMPFHKAIEEKERIKQYLDAILFYLTKSDFESIVFVDGSGIESDFFYFLFPIADFYNKKFEMLSFENDPILLKSKWKGYGENNILKFAIENSALLKNYKCFYKVTGRYLIKNINQILKNEKMNENVFFRTSVLDRSLCNTGFFKVSKELFKRELWNLWDNVNDKQGVFLEHLYLKQLTRKTKIKNFKLLPRFSWIYGGGDRMDLPLTLELIKDFCNLLWLHNI